MGADLMLKGQRSRPQEMKMLNRYTCLLSRRAVCRSGHLAVRLFCSFDDKSFFRRVDKFFCSSKTGISSHDRSACYRRQFYHVVITGNIILVQCRQKGNG